MKNQIATTPHSVSLDRGGVTNIGAFFPPNHTRIAWITDARVLDLHGTGMRAALGVAPIVVPEGESAKSLEVASECWERLQTQGLDRDSVLVSVGGGCVGDLAGFVASCYLRGIAFIQVPTTLLAMVDASIGGKNGVNLDSVKNVIGTFYQPNHVLIDPEFLTTLPPRELVGGMAEVIKYAVIRDADLFTQLEQGPGLDLDAVIARAVSIKADIVSQDERDLGIRALLNYGHTFAHAFEASTGYAIPHGEAVALGMCCAAALSLELGMVDEAFCLRQEALLTRWNLPTRIPVQIEDTTVLEFMQQDKKTRGGKLAFVLPRRAGAAQLVMDVEASKVTRALRAVRQEVR